MNYIVQSFCRWYCSTIKRPQYRLLIILGTLIYILSPIDIAPDLIPILGWIDDALLISLLVSGLSGSFWRYSQKHHNDQTIDNNSPYVTTIDVEVI